MSTFDDIDCGTFEARLEAHLDGRLDAAMSREITRHALTCDSCRELLAPFDRAPREAPEDEALVEAVMAKTSGRACERCEELLDPFLQGELAPDEVVLVREHLAMCRRCRAFADLCVAVDRVLPLLASAEVDAAFVHDVVRATSGGIRRPLTQSTWSDRLRGVFARPRLALEGAYLGTVFLVLGVATPISPWRELPGHMLDFASREPAIALEVVTDWSRRSAAWPAATWSSVSAADSTRAGVSIPKAAGAARAVAWGTWRSFRAMQRSLIGGDVREVNVELERLGRDVEALERALGLHQGDEPPSTGEERSTADPRQNQGEES